MKNKSQYILTEYTVFTRLSKPLTVGLVSDLHESDPKEVLSLLRQGKPDMIMVPGDTFERHGTGRDIRFMPEEGPGKRILRKVMMRLDDLFEFLTEGREHDSEYAYRFMQEAGKIAPVFISLGNHEWFLTEEDRRIIKESGARLLDNRDCLFQIKGETVRIGGLSSNGDLSWLDDFSRKDGYKILLCHHPEYYDRFIQGKAIDLILSGHAHGGQIRIKNRGIYSPGQGLFPKYTKGIYHQKMIVTSGAANTASVPRWGNPCEVVMISLKGRQE